MYSINDGQRANEGDNRQGKGGSVDHALHMSSFRIPRKTEPCGDCDLDLHANHNIPPVTNKQLYPTFPFIIIFNTGVSLIGGAVHSGYRAQSGRKRNFHHTDRCCFQFHHDDNPEDWEKKHRSGASFAALSGIWSWESLNSQEKMKKMPLIELLLLLTFSVHTQEEAAHTVGKLKKKLQHCSNACAFNQRRINMR